MVNPQSGSRGAPPEPTPARIGAGRSALGDWIRGTRTNQGISQRALADRSGLSRVESPLVWKSAPGR